MRSPSFTNRAGLVLLASVIMLTGCAHDGTGTGQVTPAGPGAAWS